VATVVPNQAYIVMLPSSARVHNCLPTEYQDAWGHYTPYMLAESTDGASDSYVCDWGDSDSYRDKVVGLPACCTPSMGSLLATFWDSLHFDPLKVGTIRLPIDNA